MADQPIPFECELDESTGAISFDLLDVEESIRVTLRKPKMRDWLKVERQTKEKSLGELASIVYMATLICVKYGAHSSVSQTTLEELDQNQFLQFAEVIGYFSPKRRQAEESDDNV